MIAADRKQTPVFPGDFFHGTEKFPLRFCGRKKRVEHVARNEHKLNTLALADRGDLVQHRSLFVQALAPGEAFADMPVGSVQDLHAGQGGKRKVWVICR